MDVFESAQRTRPEIEGADENLASARAKLMTEIRSESRPARSRRVKRSWLVAGGLVGAAAAVTAGVLVVGSLTSASPKVEAIPTEDPTPTSKPSSEPSPEPTTEPLTPKSAFGAAAAASAAGRGLSVAPGQYLRVRTDSEQAVYFADDTTMSGGYSADRSNAANAWVTRVSWSVYVPGDTSAQWYAKTESEEIVRMFGSAAPRLAEESRQERGAQSDHYFYDGESSPWETSGGYSMSALVQELPRNPAELVAWMRSVQSAEAGVDGSVDDYKVGWAFVDLLSDYQSIPQDVRAVIYQALTLLSGSEITDVDGDIVTVRFSAPEQSISGADAVKRRAITFDVSTGSVLKKTVTLDVASPLVPADLIDESYTYTREVVDALP